MNSLIDQAKQFWEERNFGQKFAMLFLLIALVAITTYMFSIANQPDWDVLYDDLSPSDAASVTNYLNDQAILYRLTNGGQTILVPNGVVEATRLDVAQEDLIKQDDVGLEGLMDMPIGLTDSQQKLMKQRMLQGELARTIKKIKGVKNVRVTIAEPERSIFLSEDDQPKASIMLVLEPGARIQQEKIKAIKNLVSHSISRLTPENVFVSDQSGRALSEEVGSSGSSIDELRTSYETKIKSKVKNVLSKLVGSDNITVAVTAEMNFDRSSAKIERYIPSSSSAGGVTSGVLISEQLLDEKYTGQNAGVPGGVPGTESNINNPSYATNGDDSKKSSNYNKSSKIKNFEVSKEIKDITYAPGTVERLTVAVALNKVLTSKEQSTLEKLVTTASGADIARGDVITITGMSFAEMDAIEAEKEELKQQAQVDYYISIVEKIVPYVLIIVFGGIFMGIFWSLLKKPVEGEEYADDTDDLYDLPDTPELLEAASIPVVEAKLDPEIERMRTEISSYILNDPSEAARLLLSFIKD